MRVKKLNSIIALVLAGILVSSAVPTMAMESTSLPQQVIDIANGSDEIYGPGAPLHHVNPNTRFSSGGVNHTHQYIISNALTILNNNKGASIFNTKAAILCDYTDWPDEVGNETDMLTFAGHFYDPDTGTNWLGQTSPTARGRAESYYDLAIWAYLTGNVDLAMEYLGKGTHYVSDLNESHHAANLTALNSNHSAFESYVDENRTQFYIPGNSLSTSVYNNAVSKPLGTILYDAAKTAKGLVGQAQNTSTYYYAAEQNVRNAITTVVQYIYKFGVEAGIY